MQDGFCGWYLKCQSEEHTLAFIPAAHTSGGVSSSSLQVITPTDRWNIPLPRGVLRWDRPRAILGENRFSSSGIHLNLHTNSLTAVGELHFGLPSPIRFDIMGPFRYIPWMECRHRVFSMHHRVCGQVTISGTPYRFPNGVGYIEGDRGRSFPRHYLWTQCNFPHGSLMLSVADIPLGGVHFTGIIGIVQLPEREYRLATYLGAKVLHIGGRQVTVRQGSFTFTAELLEDQGHLLHAPSSGAMTRMIRENVSCRARYHFCRNNHTILELETCRAAFEYEYPQL